MLVATLLLVACRATSALPGVKVPADELERTAAAHDAAINQHVANPATSCAADFRNSMPACKQQAADWCWATGLSEFSFYYNVSTGGATNCTAVECAVVSMDFKGKDCCPDGKIRCGGDGQTVEKIVADATKFMGLPFKSRGGPATENDLVALLEAGTPVMPIITWYKEGRPAGGHALMVSGCEASSGPFGGVQYFLHDPETSTYQKVSYSRLMYYSVLSDGKWTDTVHAS